MAPFLRSSWWSSSSSSSSTNYHYHQNQQSLFIPQSSPSFTLGHILQGEEASRSVVVTNSNSIQSHHQEETTFLQDDHGHEEEGESLLVSSSSSSEPQPWNFWNVLDSLSSSSSSRKQVPMMIASLPPDGTAQSLRVVFRNVSPVPLILCWVTANGELKHWYRLDPVDITSTQSTDYYIPLPQDHLESTRIGDAFCLVYCDILDQQEDGDGDDSDDNHNTVLVNEALNAVRSAKTLQGVLVNNNGNNKKVSASVVAAYRPSRVRERPTTNFGFDLGNMIRLGSNNNNSNDADGVQTCHLITISHDDVSSSSSISYQQQQQRGQRFWCWPSSSSSSLEGCFCIPRRFLRKRKVEDDEDNDNYDDDEFATETDNTAENINDVERGDHRKIGKHSSSRKYMFPLELKGWKCHAQLVKLDTAPIDTTTKHYEETTLGGWPCRVETNWYDGDIDFKNHVANDIAEAAKRLPDHARSYLQKHCTIYINKSLCWGPKCAPVRGRGACYHPNKQWLIDNGLCSNKHMCVEVNDITTTYKSSYKLWGPGGLFLHELSHAYHHGMVENGYNNQDIEDCYQRAMKEKLYDCVKVHGPQGPTAKAYACTNNMEYWAELSAAFLGSTNKQEEYNKWYPFNRRQIQEHDPRAYSLLSRLWKMDGNSKHMKK